MPRLSVFRVMCQMSYHRPSSLITIVPYFIPSGLLSAVVDLDPETLIRSSSSLIGCISAMICILTFLHP